MGRSNRRRGILTSSRRKETQGILRKKRRKRRLVEEKTIGRGRRGKGERVVEEEWIQLESDDK